MESETLNFKKIHFTVDTMKDPPREGHNTRLSYNFNTGHLAASPTIFTLDNLFTKDKVYTVLLSQYTVLLSIIQGFHCESESDYYRMT